MSATKPEEVTAEVAIREQIETAISLWFEDKPSTPIQSLAYNALRRVHDLSVTSKQGERSRIISELLTLPKKERDHFMLPIDFAKHGDRQMKDVKSVNLRPEVVALMLYEAIVCYASVFHTLTTTMRVFVARFRLESPPDIIEGDIPAFEKILIAQKDFAGLSRRDFLKEVEAILSEFIATKGGWPPPTGT